MTPTGFETTANSPGKTTIDPSRAAKSAAIPARLEHVWADLSPEVQAAILALAAALAYRDTGLGVIPIKGDGSKAPPDGFTWKEYQARLLGEDEIRAWFSNGRDRGVGVLGGKVSGHPEHLDFDEDASEIFPAWCSLVEAELPGLIDRLCVRQTPRTPAGYHVSYRCPEVEIPGNRPLVRRPGRRRRTSALRREVTKPADRMGDAKRNRAKTRLATHESKHW